MLPNPWIIMAVLLAIVGAAAGGEIHGRKVERNYWMAKMEGVRAEAAETALAEERTKQEEVNRAIQQQADDLASINTTLQRDIERLRSRPPRTVRVPGAGKANCQGASGADLSRPDAHFLTGLAARADQLRAALAACYAYADTVESKP